MYNNVAFGEINLLFTDDSIESNDKTYFFDCLINEIRLAMRESWELNFISMCSTSIVEI